VANHCRDSCQEAIERDESLDQHPRGVDLERRRIAMRAAGHDHVHVLVPQAFNLLWFYFG
jgi:hypothetical protein